MSIEAIRELGTLASVCPELNMANYTDDDVRHLNDWAIEMSLSVERAILALRPERVPMTDEEAKELIKKSDLLDMFLRIGWYSAPRKNFDTHALALIRAVESRYAGITAQAKKETP